MLDGVRASFMAGLHVGSAVIAGATAVAALAALVLLPHRDRAPREQPAAEPATVDS
jgi:hypothetical protein